MARGWHRFDGVTPCNVLFARLAILVIATALAFGIVFVACQPRELPPLGPRPERILPAPQLSPLIRGKVDAAVLPPNTPTRVILRSAAQDPDESPADARKDDDEEGGDEPRDAAPSADAAKAADAGKRVDASPPPPPPSPPPAPSPEPPSDAGVADSPAELPPEVPDADIGLDGGHPLR